MISLSLDPFEWLLPPQKDSISDQAIILVRRNEGWSVFGGGENGHCWRLQRLLLSRELHTPFYSSSLDVAWENPWGATGQNRWVAQT